MPGVKNREALRRLPDGSWKAGVGNSAATYSTSDLLAILDATVRLLDGALNPDSLRGEYFSAGFLGTPAYTRPASFRGEDVPEVLLSGDHARIAAWRRQQARDRTANRRPDLTEVDLPREPEA